MDWLFFGLRDFFEWSFTFIPKLGMTYNWFFIVVGTILTCWWMMKMLSHPKDKY